MNSRLSQHSETRFLSSLPDRRGGQAQSQQGVAALEIIVVGVIILIVVACAFGRLMRAQQEQLRVGAAEQFAHYLDTARNDSMRRRAIEVSKMAQLTIINKGFYSVTIDANGDGVLDTPKVISLAGQDVTMNGPFPRTFVFDSTGKMFDANHNPLSPATITFAQGYGKSVVKLSENGKAVVVQATAR